jgi:hypothetical protein
VDPGVNFSCFVLWWTTPASGSLKPDKCFGFAIGQLPQHAVILLKIEPQRGKRLGSQSRPAQMKLSGWRKGRRRDDLMQKAILALLAMLLAGLASAHGTEVQVGRYQMIAVPASQSQTFPQTLLMDTATGEPGFYITKQGSRLNGFPSGFRPERIVLRRPSRPRPTLSASRADSLFTAAENGVSGGLRPAGPRSSSRIANAGSHRALSHAAPPPKIRPGI